MKAIKLTVAFFTFIIAFSMMNMGCQNATPNNLVSQKEEEKQEKVAEEEAGMAKYQNISIGYEAQTRDELIELQKEYRRLLHDSFEKFESHPEVMEKGRFLKDNAFFSLPRGPVVTLTSIQPGEKDPHKNPHGFEIVVMPVKYKSHYPAYVTVQGRTMRIIADFQVKEWLGVIVMHEMVHIMDYVVNKVDRHTASHEVKAYKFEMQLLEMWNRKGYRRMVEESNSYISKVGGIFKLQHNDLLNLIAIASQYYPLSDEVVSEAESSLGAAACVMSMALEYSSHLSDEELVRVYGHVARVLMGR